MAADLPATIHCKGSAEQELPAGTPLVEEIIQGWRDGGPACAEQALADHPELEDNPDAVLRLVYEEVCLRRERGETIEHDEIARRFPRWQAQLDVLLHCHSLLNPFVVPPSWPKVGDSIGEFELVAELGRGGHGRVFLANQSGLGDRPVVLKLIPWDEQEHLTLARLQHTHIVPLYAETDDPTRRLRALCMPYYGGVPLHELIATLTPIAVGQRTGQQLLQTVDRLQVVGALPSSSRSPARQHLARLGYIDAVCWIGACVAEALEYAHERGVLHLDLKPSNVLVAADGQPMLLDFHLARPPLVPGAAPPEWFGGTPGYMSPEQELALDQANRRQPLTVAVDERSDVYALGLLLYEALGGTIPIPAGDAMAALRRHAPQISPGLAAIIRKCLAADPAQRYQHAKMVAIDLRRHLSNLPLKGVPNRSLVEHWQKWRRRQPYGLTLALLVGLALAAFVGWGTFGWRQVEGAQDEAQQLLAEGRQHRKAHAYAAAVDVLMRSSSWASRSPTAGRLQKDIEQELRLARRGQAAQQLHDLADRARFLYDPAGPASKELSAVQSLWDQVWERRRLILGADTSKLSEQIEQQLEHDLLDLSLIWADLCVHGGDAAAQRRALQVLQEAETLFGPSQVLYRQRHALARALGNTELAEEADRRAETLPPRTAWEHSALGRSLLHAGDLNRAAEALQQAVDMLPQDFWPNFYQGVCAYRRGRYGEAVTAFSVGIALAPESAECHYNRALALAAQGRTSRALHGYDRALELNPDMAAAALNRGLLYLQSGSLTRAQADLEHALEEGADPATVHYNLARLALARDDRRAALASARRAVAANPEHAGARQLLAQLESSVR